MKIKNITLIFLGIISCFVTFGVIFPFLISSYDTIYVLTGIGLLIVVVFVIALIGNSLITKFFKKENENEKK